MFLWEAQIAEDVATDHVLGAVCRNPIARHRPRAAGMFDVAFFEVFFLGVAMVHQGVSGGS